MQHEITVKQNLLRSNGALAEAGFARQLILDYQRQAVKANTLRIKEWDYFLIMSDHYALALTIADNTYMGLDSISFIDFQKRIQVTKSPIRFFTMGQKRMPENTGSGHTKSAGKKHLLSFHREESHWILTFRMDNFIGSTPVSGKIVLQDHKGDSIVMATPFAGDPRAFYYNQKINCLPAGGIVKLGKKTYRFEPAQSFGVLDWGRGVWSYKNTWYWGSASGLLNEVPFGFNIGYGFGDTSAATENMIFYQNKGHKLSHVSFHIPMKNGRESYLEPWWFHSDDKRFEMVFQPIIDRAACTDIGVICSDQHQVFGRFSGKAVLDDGRILKIKDFMGFAEKVYNKW